MHDFRYALRLIAKNWTFSIPVIVILALCVGANTAVLSVVDAAMVKALAYPQPERLVHVVSIYSHGEPFETSVDGVTWELVRDRVPSLELAMYGEGFGDEVNMGVNGSGVLVHQGRVTAGFFHVLGVAPEMGREFSQDEDREGGPVAVMVSHSLWQKYLGGDRGVVGKTILLRGEPHTIIGVMPDGSQMIDEGDVWTALRPSTKGEGSGSNYGMIARLKPGATMAEARAQLALLTDEVRARGSYGKNSGVTIGVVPLRQAITSDLREPLKIVWIAVAAVFVLGCVNIGGMLLARASARTAEIATRYALGASAGRVIRQLLSESAMLGVFGGIAGIGVGWGGLAALRALGAQTFPFLRVAAIDWRVMLASFALTLAAGVAFGLMPAWQASRAGVRASSRTVAGRRRFVSMGVLVGGQVALAVPLLIAAGLLLRTFLFLWNQNPGFDPNHVLTARFSMQDARYQTGQKMTQYYDRVISRLHETPGIEAAAVALTLPYERALNTGFSLDGKDYLPTNLVYVTPEYFRALKIPLLAGREFTPGDGPDAPKVAVVNQALVDRYMKDQAAAGRVIELGGKQVTIVGVAGSVMEKRAGWGNFGPIARVPTMFVPAAQVNNGLLTVVHTWFTPSWIVRTSLPDRETIAAIQDAARSADPLLPIAEFRSFNDLKAGSLREQRFLAALVDVLGGLAILLTALGIYGLIANLVSERTRELGIRMALGASAGDAVRVALRPGLLWVLAGAVMGGAAAMALERFLKSYLYGIGASDPVTLGLVGAGLLMATLIASMIPASRIVRLNPADTLRAE